MSPWSCDLLIIYELEFGYSAIHSCPYLKLPICSPVEKLLRSHLALYFENSNSFLFRILTSIKSSGILVGYHKTRMSIREILKTILQTLAGTRGFVHYYSSLPNVILTSPQSFTPICASLISITLLLHLISNRLHVCNHIGHNTMVQVFNSHLLSLMIFP